MQNEKSKLKKEFFKRLVRFSLSVIELHDSLGKERKYWSILDQLIRSATSIGANIIEAQAASSKKDYIKFFDIALKSANETKYWLILLRESSHTTRVDDLLKEVNEIANIIGSSLLTLKGRR